MCAVGFMARDDDKPELYEHAGQLREFLFTFLESLPSGIILADQDGYPIAVNQKCRSLLNIMGSSSWQQSCWQILERNLHLDPADLEALQENSSASIICETTPPSPGLSEKRYFHLSKNVLQSPFINISGFILSLEDITFQIMAEEQFERRKRFEAMQEIAVHMSQELKNPLGSLELYASMLKREVGADPDQRHIVERMHQALKAMDFLLNNYMTFVRLPEPHWGKVQVNKWLEDTTKQLRLLDKGKNVTITVDCNHIGSEIRGDSDLLHQLALNLGLNAIEAMEDEGKLRLQTRTIPQNADHPEFLELSFIDKGSGIPQKIVSRIFDPFFTTKKGRSGLGLSVAHYIAEAHHGLLRVESSEREGTTVIVMLPGGE